MSGVVKGAVPPAARRGGGGLETAGYAGTVLLGAALIVVTAIHQPLNQNELQQMAPYDSSSLSTITGGTRQPPLDPLLGALVQHLLGEGQLRQRLVPVCAGIGTLVLMSVLLRRMRLGVAGVVALAALATAPLMVRFSAYSRPYALPLVLMMLFVYAAERWLDSGRRRWLVAAGLAGAALPLARVPEPTIFLFATAVTLAWLAYRGRFAWSRAGPIVAVSVAALGLVGYPMFRALASAAPGLWDPSPSGFVNGFGEGAREFFGSAVPL
nr:glycosyltransferase family 39 protein [Propionibacteriales bacterium]